MSTRFAIFMGVIWGCFSSASAQPVSSYDVGRHMAALEKRLDELERNQSNQISKSDLNRIKAELSALERQVQQLPSQDFVQFKHDLAEVKRMLLKFDAALTASTPTQVNGGAATLVAAIPESSVKQIGQETFRVVIRKADGWFDTRLPHVGGCQYQLKGTINTGRYEVTTGSGVQWYNAAIRNPQDFSSREIGTFRIRVNDESPEAWIALELSRSLPAAGACYAPDFEPLPSGKTMCDVVYLQRGDDRPVFSQGLDSVAPLFGQKPQRSEPKRATNPACGTDTPGGSTTVHSGAAQNQGVRPVVTNPWNGNMIANPYFKAMPRTVELGGSWNRAYDVDARVMNADGPYRQHVVISFDLVPDGQQSYRGNWRETQALGRAGAPPGFVRTTEAVFLIASDGTRLVGRAEFARTHDNAGQWVTLGSVPLMCTFAGTLRCDVVWKRETTGREIMASHAVLTR